MRHDKIDHRIVIAGFGALAVVIGVECLALANIASVAAGSRPPSMEWGEAIMRLLFGHIR